VSSSAEEREASKPVIAEQSVVTQRVLALVYRFANPFGMIYALRSIQVLVYFTLGFSSFGPRLLVAGGIV
jgi:hypothetical protein